MACLWLRWFRCLILDFHLTRDWNKTPHLETAPGQKMLTIFRQETAHVLFYNPAIFLVQMNLGSCSHSHTHTLAHFAIFYLMAFIFSHSPSIMLFISFHMKIFLFLNTQSCLLVYSCVAWWNARVSTYRARFPLHITPERHVWNRWRMAFTDVH